jgi:hypothetical protein
MGGEKKFEVIHVDWSDNAEKRRRGSNGMSSNQISEDTVRHRGERIGDLGGRC